MFLNQHGAEGVLTHVMLIVILRSMKHKILTPFTDAQRAEVNAGVSADLPASKATALSHSAIISPCSKGIWQYLTNIE